MIIKVLLNSENYVYAYSIIGDITNSISVELPEESLNHFEDNYKAYFYFDGALIYNDDKNTLIQNELQLNELRAKREVECFSVINRGKLWYDSLTEEQIIELNIWYADWLNVTETLVVPEHPTWLI